MRRPSIKVYTDDLRMLLISHLGKEAAIEICAEIVKLSTVSVPALEHRQSVTVSKSKAEKVKKVKSVDAEDIRLFNKALVNARIKLNHFGVRPVSEGSSQYSMLADVVEMANQFASELCTSSEKYDAYYQYCLAGVKMMGKVYGINKFKYFNQRIFDEKAAAMLVASDDVPTITQYMIAVWKFQMKKRTKSEVLLSAADLVNFVHARREAQAAKADYKHWVKAQFTGLDFMNKVPFTTQLHGDGALKRYIHHTQEAMVAGESVVSISDAEWVDFINNGK